jgi:chemotaxis protein methyltransferase CheR
MFSFFKKKKNDNVTSDNDVQPEEPFNSFGFNDILYFIKRETGVDLFPKQNVIETRLRVFAQNQGCPSFRKLFELIQYQESIKQELINLLTVNETYFYRELSQLQEAVDFARERNSVRILCAPCASGEEVYTFSMLLQENANFKMNYSITGVDINSEAIQKAQQGIYTARSLHKVGHDLIARYFTSEDGKYKIRKEKFQNVNFSKVNIFNEQFLRMGKYDIVFSRNMLIYFDEEFRLQAMRHFLNLLKEGGRIYLGHADIIPPNDFLQKHGFGSSCYYTNKEDVS